MKTWWPVVTLIVGWAGAMMTEYLRNRSVTKREARARTDLWAIEDAREAKSFQRETVLSLQDAMVRLGRAIAELHGERHTLAAARTQTWATRPLSSENFTAATEAAFEINALRVRLDSSTHRDEVESAVSKCLDCRDAQNEDASWSRLLEAGPELDALQDTLGDYLRSLR